MGIDKYKKAILMQKLEDALILISSSKSGSHCVKYNVVYMIRAMLKQKDDYHIDTVEVLETLHNRYCEEGY